ncbi:hypothetical protein BH09ACT6_BH09ACT6_21550 [soil metagenome]
MSDDTRRVLYAEFTALPGREAEVAALIGRFAETVRREPGNLVFAAHTKCTAGSEFFVYEEYADEAAFQRHLETDSGAEFNRGLGPLVVGGRSALTFLSPV